MIPLNEWLSRWEPIWLFLILAIEMVAGLYTAYMVKKEYDYDRDKDIAKRKRTRTKKTTTNPGGASIVEETEIIEGDVKGDQNEKGI